MADALIPASSAARSASAKGTPLTSEPRRSTSQRRGHSVACARVPIQCTTGYSLLRSIANTLNRTWPPPIAHWPQARRLQPAVHASLCTLQTSTYSLNITRLTFSSAQRCVGMEMTAAAGDSGFICTKQNNHQ